MKRYIKALGKSCIIVGVGTTIVVLLSYTAQYFPNWFSFDWFAFGFLIALIGGLTWVFSNE